jgi:hypothetical protein
MKSIAVSVTDIDYAEVRRRAAEHLTSSSAAVEIFMLKLSTTTSHGETALLVNRASRQARVNDRAARMQAAAEFSDKANGRKALESATQTSPIFRALPNFFKKHAEAVQPRAATIESTS